jgi:hypothetical protein
MLLVKALDPCFHGFCDRDLACLSPSIAPHPQIEFVKAIWYSILYLCFLNKISYLLYHICYIISAISYPEIYYILYDIIYDINSNNMISYMILFVISRACCRRLRQGENLCCATRLWWDLWYPAHSSSSVFDNPSGCSYSWWKLYCLVSMEAASIQPSQIHPLLHMI